MASAPAFSCEATRGRCPDALGPCTKDRVLDLGCGEGIVWAALGPRTESITGVEITPEMIRTARERGSMMRVRTQGV
jgi:predicted TPR repeat methyltransferase